MIVAAKTASQIAVHMSVAFGIMYSFTGSVAFGGLAALLEPICVVGVLPLHDRMWDKIGAILDRRADAARTRRPAELMPINQAQLVPAYDAT